MLDHMHTNHNVNNII